MQLAELADLLGDVLHLALRLRVLTETVTSPTLADQLRALRERFQGAKWHRYEPAGNHNARGGALLAFGPMPDAGLATGRLIERDVCEDPAPPAGGRVVLPSAPGLGAP